MNQPIEWNRKLRIAVFLFLYAAETAGSTDDTTIEMSYEVSRIDSCSLETFTEFIQQVYSYFQDHKEQLEEQLKTHLPQWNQTFEATKVVLHSYLIERALYPENETPIKDYIRITQDFIGGDNPKMIHAVLSKLEL